VGIEEGVLMALLGLNLEIFWLELSQMGLLVKRRTLTLGELKFI
jgi:hypothetical protein